eukprot:s2811_g1.t1
MNQDPVAAGGPVLLGSKHGQKEGKDVARALQDELGVTATVTKQFQRGNFLVLLVSIEQIDMRKMIASKSSEKMLKRFDKFMHFLSHLPSWVMMDLQNLVLLQVGNGLIQKMPDTRRGGAFLHSYEADGGGCSQLSIGLRVSEDGELLGPSAQLPFRDVEKIDASLDTQFGDRGLIGLLVRELQDACGGGQPSDCQVLLAGILK